MTKQFGGLTVALATPLTESGDLDLAAFRRLVRHVVKGGVDQLLALGSTGEGSLLDEAERGAIIEACLEAASGRPVLVGTGHSSTAEAIRQTRQASELGCQGALVVVPPYVKPEPAGVAAHFSAIADAVPELPLLLYNVPGRTGRNLGPDDLEQVWNNPRVVAIKESSADAGQIGRLAGCMLPAGRTLLCGDDHLALTAIAVGSHGLVSVVGNLLPRETKELVDAALDGRLDEARGLIRRLLPVIEALFVESNPIPLKAGLRLLELAGDGVRLPLTRASDDTRVALGIALERARFLPLPGGHHGDRSAVSFH